MRSFGASKIEPNLNPDLDQILSRLAKKLLQPNDEWQSAVKNLPIDPSTKNSLADLHKVIHTKSNAVLFENRIKQMQEVLMAYAKLEFDSELAMTGATDNMEALAITINVIGEELKSSYQLNTEQKAKLKEDSIKLKDLNDELISSLITQKFLTRELHHRVKNNLQFISSLLWFHIKDTSNEELHEAFSSLEKQINVIAKVHELMLKSREENAVELKEYITALGSSIIAASPIKGELLVSGETVDINSECANYLGICLNELITNTIKHGWSKLPSEENRVLTISISVDDNDLSIHYQEQGSAFDYNYETRGIGSELLEKLLFQQLRAKSITCEDDLGCQKFVIGNSYWNPIKRP